MEWLLRQLELLAYLQICTRPHADHHHQHTNSVLLPVRCHSATQQILSMHWRWSHVLGKSHLTWGHARAIKQGTKYDVNGKGTFFLHMQWRKPRNEIIVTTRLQTSCKKESAPSCDCVPWHVCMVVAFCQFYVNLHSSWYEMTSNVSRQLWLL